MEFNDKEHLYVEKYRPTKINDCILQERTKKELKAIIEKGDKIPNLLLYGSAGIGKTSVARALCLESNVDWILMNGSNERGIDAVRDRVISFASTSSLSGNDHKVVIIDECDRLTPIAQDSLKSEQEKFSKNCSFIFTANHPTRLITPLRSRLVSINFDPRKEEIERMQAEFFMRICEILNNEKVTYNESVLIKLIQKYFPDNRRILGELQQYARGSNDINEGILLQLKGANIDSLINHIVNKKFRDIMQWAADNTGNDTSNLYEDLYKKLKDFVKSSSIPDAILIIEEYQRWDNTVPSKELHLSSMAVELMTSLEFL